MSNIETTRSSSTSPVLSYSYLIEAIRTDKKVGRGTGSMIDETMTDDEVLQMLAPVYDAMFSITPALDLKRLNRYTAASAVRVARRVDREFWERREDTMAGVY